MGRSEVLVGGVGVAGCAELNWRGVMVRHARANSVSRCPPCAMEGGKISRVMRGLSGTRCRIQIEIIIENVKQDSTCPDQW